LGDLGEEFAVGAGGSETESMCHTHSRRQRMEFLAEVGEIAKKGGSVGQVSEC